MRPVVALLVSNSLSSPLLPRAAQAVPIYASIECRNACRKCLHRPFSVNWVQFNPLYPHCFAPGLTAERRPIALYRRLEENNSSLKRFSHFFLFTFLSKLIYSSPVVEVASRRLVKKKRPGRWPILPQHSQERRLPFLQIAALRGRVSPAALFPGTPKPET